MRSFKKILIVLHFKLEWSDATSEYFESHPAFLRTVVEHGNMMFEQFEFQNFLSFFDYCVTLKLPLNEKIVENWCLFVEPALQEVETEELETILKLFAMLNIRPPKDFTYTFFNAIQNKLPTLHVQNIINLLSQHTFLNHAPPAQWSKCIIKNLTPLLKYLTSNSLFSLPKNICIKGILNDESFAREWFFVSAQNMAHVNIDVLINSTLYSLHKFEAEIPVFWFNAFSQKTLKNFDLLKIYNVAHLLQGLSYTFVNPKFIKDVLHACQNFITHYDAPTYDKISLNDLNKIIPAMNYFNPGEVVFSIGLEKYQEKIQSLLTPDDKNNESNALLTEYVREYFEVGEHNKPIEQILRCVNLYIHSCNLVILISNEKNRLRSRLNAEILRLNKYNLITLSKDKFENLGKEYVDFEINKYLSRQQE